MRLLVNGRDDAGVDPRDRGLHYGDGLFETVAIRNGRPRLLPLHVERLSAGCRRLGLPVPDAGLLEAEIAAVIDGPTAVVKVIVTRGAGGRGYRPPSEPEATRIVAAYPDPGHPAEFWSRGIRLRTCRTRIATSPQLAGLKHLGRLEHVLARAEWRDASVAEGLMLDEAGRVVSGTQSNLFLVRDGELLTPSVEHGGVAGVMRRAVLEWATGHRMPAREPDIGPGELFAADEVFVTNAVIGAWPVAELDGRPLPRGPVAEAFSRWLDAS